MKDRCELVIEKNGERILLPELDSDEDILDESRNSGSN